MVGFGYCMDRGITNTISNLSFFQSCTLRADDLVMEKERDDRHNFLLL